MLKNVNILKFDYYIWNPHEKYIEISTNIPSIGLIIREIGFEILEFGANKTLLLHGKTNDRIECVKLFIDLSWFARPCRALVNCLATKWRHQHQNFRRGGGFGLEQGPL